MPAEERNPFMDGILAALAGKGGVAPTSSVASTTPPQTSFPQTASGGGGVVLDHLMRHAKTFRIFESDLLSLEQMNRRALLLFSASGFFINIGLGIVIGFAFADPIAGLSDFGKLLSSYGSYTAFGISFLFFAFGVWEWLIKQGNVDKIYEEHGLERKHSWRGVSISPSKKPGNPAS